MSSGRARSGGNKISGPFRINYRLRSFKANNNSNLNKFPRLASFGKASREEEKETRATQILNQEAAEAESGATSNAC